MEEVEGEQTGSDGVGSGGRWKRKEERSCHDTDLPYPRVMREKPHPEKLRDPM